MANNLSSTNGTEETEQIEKISTVVILLVNGFGVIVVLVNVMVLLIMLTQKRFFRQKELWLQLIFLCLNDTLAGFSIIMASFLDHEPFSISRLACRLALVIALMSQITTVCHIIAIGIRRIRILRSIRNAERPWRAKYSFIQAAIVFVIGILFLIVATVAWPTDGPDRINGCQFSAAYGKYKSYATTFVGISIVIPLLITDGLYMYLCIVLKQIGRTIVPVNDNSLNQNNSNGPSSSNNSSQCRPIGPNTWMQLRRYRMERNATMLCLVILLAINFTTWPTLIMQVNTILSTNSKQIQRTVKLPVAAIIILNSVVNPFIYTIRMQDFRKAAANYFKNLFRIQ